MNDKDNLIGQGVKKIVKEMGADLKKGNIKDVFKVATPAYMHTKYSHLEAMAIDMGYMYMLFDEAGDKRVDPIKRLERVTAAYVAGQHLAVSTFGATSPLNPILGETIERELYNGAKLYFEQTSHHPPVSHFLLEGPNEEVRVHGYAMYKVGLQSINTANGSR